MALDGTIYGTAMAPTPDTFAPLLYEGNAVALVVYERMTDALANCNG
jgi:hypothetical protein